MQALFAFTLEVHGFEHNDIGPPLHQPTTGVVVKELVYVQYFASPESNAWRARHGDKPQSQASLNDERNAIGFKCPTVEPCFIYTKGGKKLPWVQVVPLEDVTRMVSFAPHFIRNSETAEKWFVYDLLPVSSAHATTGMSEVMAEHFRGQLEG